MTPSQQALFARYGTYDPAEIAKKKQAEPQSRDVVTQKGMAVKMTAEECEKACKAVGLEYLDGYEGRVLEYVMSDESVDRMGDIMIMAGANLKEFNTNRVILRMHDYREFPVGYGLKVWVEGKQLRGRVLFLDDRVDTSGVADRAFRFAKSGVMKACSIGFGADSVKYPSQEEREELGMKLYGVIFEKWTLREVSVCPVPANKNALAEAVAKGLLQPEDAKFVTGEEVTPPIPDEEREKVTPPPTPDQEVETILDGLTEEKAGKKISAATRSKIQKIHDRMDEGQRAHRRCMKECLEDLKSLLAMEIPEDDEDEEGEEKAAVADSGSSLAKTSQRIRMLRMKEFGC